MNDAGDYPVALFAPVTAGLRFNDHRMIPELLEESRPSPLQVCLLGTLSKANCAEGCSSFCFQPTAWNFCSMYCTVPFSRKFFISWLADQIHEAGVTSCFLATSKKSLGSK